jgi:apolipoprotein N-acyltransferase
MRAKAAQLIQKSPLFLIPVMLITLTSSFSLFSPLLFVVFPVVFKLIRGKKQVIQIILLFALVVTVCNIVFVNAFFIQTHYFLFFLMCLYFALLLGLDFFITFYTLKYTYGLLLVFGYITLSRFILSMSTSIFPFYWTLTMHLLPFMGAASRFILPLFWEALCVSFSVMVYFFHSHKPARLIILQAAALVFIATSLSGIAKAAMGPPVLKSGLECTIVQGGYSRHDYVLVENHPILGKKIAQKYLDHIEEAGDARFLVLPESAFPLLQIEESEILQNIRDAARLRDQYIMTGFLLEEDGKAYNASLLIDPEGRLQNVYRKRNTVLFVETGRFTQGVLANTFTVDGHIIAPIICYESLFIRDYFRDRKPELYIVISNDIFAEKTILSTLHQAYGVINARTLGIPLLQVMQNGPSFYVDTQGYLTNLTMPYEKVIGLPVEIH